MSDKSDFDFLIGNWTIANRRLRIRGVGSSDWDEFPATGHCFKLLEGVVNVDDFLAPARGLSGASVRTFEAASQSWSIYWIGGASGKMFPPVHGSFANGGGEFFGKDEDDGQPVDVRFRWSFQADGRPLWEQAFSRDGGASWETNWYMDFTRA